VNRKYFFVSILVGVALSWQCIEPPVEPILPTWDVDLSLPLMHREYTLEELVDKNPDILSVDDNGTLVYSLSDTLADEPIGEIMTLHPEPSVFAFEAGTFILDLPDVQFQAPVHEHVPAGLSGTMEPVGSAMVSGFIPEIGSIDYMVAETGSIALQLVNTTGLPVEIPGGVELRNADDNALVGIFNYPGIVAAGGSVTAAAPLDGVRVYRYLTYRFTFSSPGTESGTTPSDPSFDFTLSFVDVKVREAHAQIPEQTLDSGYDGAIVVDDSTYFREMAFSGGAMAFSIRNVLDLELPVIVTVPDLYQRNNPAEQYQETRLLHRYGSEAFVIDMKDWLLRTENGELKNELAYTIRPGAMAATHDYRTIRSDDTIDGELSVMENENMGLAVESMDGILPVSRYPVDDRPITIDLGDVGRMFEGNVTFGSAELSLDLSFNGGFESDAEIHIVGTNDRGIRDSLSIPPDLRRVPGGEPVTIVLDGDNSTINEFLGGFMPGFPNALTVAGDIVVNPDGSDGTLDAGNALTAEMRLSIPFDVGIQGGIVRDTIAIGGSSDGIDREAFDYINYGTMYFESTNGIPVDMEMRMHLIDGMGVVLRELPVSGQPAIDIAAAKVDGSGKVVEPTDPEIRMLELGPADIQALRESDSAVLLLLLNTADNDNVLFRTDDFVKIRIFATFSVRADFN
jgi:hypothetical protein